MRCLSSIYRESFLTDDVAQPLGAVDGGRIRSTGCPSVPDKSTPCGRSPRARPDDMEALSRRHARACRWHPRLRARSTTPEEIATPSKLASASTLLARKIEPT